MKQTLVTRSGQPTIIRIQDGRQFLECPNTGLKVPRKTVHPSRGAGIMRCSNCGGTGFRAHIRPIDHGGGHQVVELVCNDGRGGGCNRVIKLDDQGRLEQGAKPTTDQASKGVLTHD